MGAWARAPQGRQQLRPLLCSRRMPSADVSFLTGADAPPPFSIMQDVYSTFGKEYIAVEGTEAVTEANILSRFADGTVKIKVNHVTFFHSMVRL